MTFLLELGMFALLAAATAVGVTVAMREAPGLRGLNERGIKPVACDLCMTFWSTLAIVGAEVAIRDQLEHVGAWMPAFAVAYFWLQRISPVPEGGPEFGELPDQHPTTPPGGEPPAG